MKELIAGFDQELIMIWGLKVVYAVGIFIVGLFVARIISGFIGRLLGRKVSDEALLNFVRTVVYSVLVVVVVIAALDQLGVDTTSLVAVVGAAGLAVGLALKDSMQNVASGIMLIMMRPFKAGDYVEAGGTAGTVQRIGLFTSMFTTPDNREVTIPNGAITGGSIINFSARDSRRIDLVFGVHYDDDLDKVRQLIVDVLNREARVLKDPEPVIAVAELADNSVNFYVRPWVSTSEYWPTRFALIEAMKKTFDSNGITIPYPQRDVHHFQEPAVGMD